MMTESCEIVAKVFYCSSCDYTTSRKSSYGKHILTSKHKMLTNVDAKLSDIVTTKKSNICECGKIFKFRQSLHVHKKKCNKGVSSTTEEYDTKKADEPTDKELMMLILKDNSELKKMIMEVVKN